jgi:SAM-dependent methyltransferase
MDRKTIEENLSKYKWYHLIELEDGIVTPGYAPHVQIPSLKDVHKALRSIPLEGRRVLDIGCRDGLFSFEAEKLGAREVIGIDNDVSAGATEFLIPYFGSQVKMYELNVYDLKPETFGKFDVVIFAGVLYHLRYPFWALKCIRDVMEDDGQIIIETAVLDAFDEHALLYCPSEAESPYGVTSVTFFNAKGLTDTLYSMGITVRSVSYCYKTEATGESPGLLRSLKRRIFPLRLLKRRILNFAASVKQRFVKKAPLADDNLLSKGNLLPDGKMGPIDRGTFICDVTPNVVDQDVLTYWEHTHKFHSTDSQDRGSIATKLGSNNDPDTR